MDLNVRWSSQYFTLLERMLVQALKIDGEQFGGSYLRVSTTVVKNYSIIMGSCYFEIVLCANLSKTFAAPYLRKFSTPHLDFLHAACLL